MIKSFIYPDIKETDRTYSGFSSPIILLDGDWRQFLPLNEDQRVAGVESSACFIEAQQAIIATLMEVIYGIKDSNFSARFNALLSGGTEVGGDPIKGALSIKKDGLVSQSSMDWNDVSSWDYFHSWNGVDKEKCLLEGKNFVNQWDMSYRIVFEKDCPIETKYVLLKEALKRSPVAVSVYAWVEKDGVYYKPEGVRDTHLTMVAVSVNDKGQVIVRDTYFPYLKTLEKDTDFEFAMSWAIRKRNPQEQLQEIQKSLIIILRDYVLQLFRKIYKVGGAILSGIFSKRN